MKLSLLAAVLLSASAAPAWAGGPSHGPVPQQQYQYQYQQQNQKQQQTNQPNQTIEGDRVDVPRQAPAVLAPALTSAGQNVCLGSFSVGVSVYGAGAAFGKTTTDKGCERRNNAALLHQFGRPDAALRLLMLDDEVREALSPSASKVALPDVLPPLVNRPWEASELRAGQ